MVSEHGSLYETVHPDKKKQEVFSKSVGDLQPKDRVLGLQRTGGAEVERHESQIRDENNGAAVGETMRAMEQQCCDKVGDDNEGERRVTKLSKSVTIWSLVCLCLQLLLGFGRQKHERVEKRIQLQGGK